MSETELLFLGLDCSTQTLKGQVINEYLTELGEYETVVNFDSDLPQFETKGGVHRNTDGSVTTPPLLWISALDLLLERMKQKGVPFHSIKAISGSGQQHGSVYWKKGTEDKLRSLDPQKSLATQSKEWFAVNDSPIWMDSSTTKYCKELEEHLGGPQRVAEVTGSVAYERFTVNQIRKIAQERQKDYQQTERISLVSSFLSSLFLGRYAPIDLGDASGTNALDIRKGDWDPKIISFAAPNLADLLGPPSPSHAILGSIHSYFVERFGFSSSCSLVAFTGDNPSSVAGLRLREGEVAVSLGTSDTIFGPLKDPHPSLEGHVFCDPIHPGGFMALLCYKNGSLTREHVRDVYADGRWDTFNQKLLRLPPGNEGKIGMYFKEMEITPRVFGFHRFSTNGESIEEFEDKDTNVRAIIESQFLSMALRTKSIGLNVKRIFATGGASSNVYILQILSDIFGVPIFVHSQPNSACLGAAYRALHGWKSADSFVDFDELMSEAVPFAKAVDPGEELSIMYQKMQEQYRKLEAKIVR